MALNPLRIRRTLTTLTALHRTLSVPNPTVPTVTGPISNFTHSQPPSSKKPSQQNYVHQPTMNNRDYAPRGSEPSYQGGYSQGGLGNYNSQERRDFAQGGQRDYMPPEQMGFRGGDQRNTVPSQGGNHGHGPSSGYGQNFGQWANPGYGRSYGQGSNPGYDQNYGPGASDAGKRANPGHGQTYPGHGAGQGFSQAEQRNVQREPIPFRSTGQGGGQQGRY